MLIHVHLVLIPLLLLIAAMFAAAEASLFSLNRGHLEILKETRPSAYAKIRFLLYQPDSTLSTIIIGNECLNILIGTFITGLLEFQFGIMDDRLTIFLSVLLSSGLLLVFSEILPKVIAFRMPSLIATILVFPLTGAHLVLTPLRKIFLGVSRRIIRLFGIPVSIPSAVSEQDFLTLVEVGAESGSLDRDEKEMISNVFHFSDLTVSAVMTSWQNVSSVPDTATPEEILTHFKKRPFSRIPVISEKMHRVVGVLYAKELLKLLLHRDATTHSDLIKEATFPPYIVSTHKKISKLFREFKLKKVHMALVVDEFGNHLGVVTLEDILNAIFQTQKKAEKQS